VRGKHLVINRKWLPELEISYVLVGNAGVGKLANVGVADPDRSGAALESAIW
jgi:hypothetical protein